MLTKHPVDYNNALQHLLSAANIFAPNAEAQAGFARIVSAMQKDGASPSDISAQIVCALYDGMTYSNWPKKHWGKPIQS